MSKQQTFDPRKAYENQIEPLLNKLLARCKHYGFSALTAISVPLNEFGGLTMTQMLPNKDGMVPAEFAHAQKAIEDRADLDPRPTESASTAEAAAAG